MEIKKVIKTSKGNVEFKGTITEEEHDFLIEYALNSLITQGALPFMDENNIPVEGNGEVH